MSKTGQTKTSQAAQFVWDPQRVRVADANAQAVALFDEPSLLDLVERPFAPSGAVARSLARLAALAANLNGDTAAVAGTIPHAGKHRFLRVTATLQPLPDGRDGLSVTVLGPAAHDDTADRLAALGEAIAAPGALFAADGRWLAGNDAAVAMLGEAPRTLSHLVADPKAAARLIGQALADGLASAPFKIATRFGPRLARVTVTRARDPKTGAPAAAAYFNDIADRARIMAAPAAQPHSTAAVADSAGGKSGRDQVRAMLAHVGHELRTPLNAILGFSQIIAGEHLGRIGHPKYAEYARDIQAGGEHLLALVDDIVEMARSGSERQPLQFETVDIARLMKQMSDLLGAEAASRGLALNETVAEDLPPVSADVRALRQILINLIANAIKFTRSGGCVTLAARASGSGGVTVEVADTGIGMTAEQLAAALEPFGQIEAAQEGLPRATSEQGVKRGLARGLGLGLPLARALAEANKAEFEIESAPGKGTCVRLVFPPARTPPA